MTIRIYNTEKRAKEQLDPRVPGRVAMYVCGPTVYDSCHIGHARPAVVFDSVRRYLEYAGFVVNFISNITDIDDKIIRRARERGVACPALASRYQDEYERDMAALGVRSPGIRPRATEHIPEMIALVSGLLERGAAYSTPRGVWFDVTKFPDYGRLSGRSRDDENTEHRVEQDPDKRHPQDFALWKAKKPDEPFWEAPFGAGRPGWHLECSAMAGKYADYALDIHGGGSDLCFPHHENELAQSEAFTGRLFVRHWMHNGFITVGKEGGADGADADGDGEKMGKSKGNAFWLADAFRLAGPAALRLWILGTHYRMPLLYRPELLVQNRAGLDRVYNTLESLPASAGGDENGLRDIMAFPALAEADASFRAALDDDFNTPQALAALYALLSHANQRRVEGASENDLLAVRRMLESWLSVLGLPLERPASNAGEADALIELLLDERQKARQAKDFAASDRIRDGLARLGVTVNDRGGASTWTRT